MRDLGSIFGLAAGAAGAVGAAPGAGVVEAGTDVDDGVVSSDLDSADKFCDMDSAGGDFDGELHQFPIVQMTEIVFEDY
jgi:hypothetical protein